MSVQYCPDCGRICGEADRFCASCGRKLGTSVSAHDQPTQSIAPVPDGARRPWVRRYGIVAGTTIGLASVAMVVGWGMFFASLADRGGAGMPVLAGLSGSGQAAVAVVLRGTLTPGPTAFPINTPSPTTSPTPPPTPTLPPTPTPVPYSYYGFRLSAGLGIDAPNGKSLDFPVKLSLGQRSDGYFSDAAGNKVTFWITDPVGRTIYNPGIVSGRHAFAFKADRDGTFHLMFKNDAALTGRTMQLYWRVTS